jgi:ActR/RegA family two-component response regulator
MPPVATSTGHCRLINVKTTIDSNVLQDPLEMKSRTRPRRNARNTADSLPAIIANLQAPGNGQSTRRPWASREQDISREEQAQPPGDKMNVRLVLLLTRDPNFEKLLAEALRKGGLSVFVTRSVDEALQTVCTRCGELEFAVIDFDDGCHGMTLLRAINACHRELPIIVVTSSDLDHAAALAYVNGAAVCLAKPITAIEVELVLNKLRQPKLQLIGA